MWIQLSTLTYADTLWGELSAMCNDNLQRLHAKSSCSYHHETKQFKWGYEYLSMVRHKNSPRLGRNKCILVFKCLHALVPKYLISEYFIRNSSIHLYNTRRRNDIHLDEPKPKWSLGKRTFIHTLKHFCLILYHQELKHLLRCYLSRTLLDWMTFDCYCVYLLL